MPLSQINNFFKSQKEMYRNIESEGVILSIGDGIVKESRVFKVIWFLVFFQIFLELFYATGIITNDDIFGLLSLVFLSLVINALIKVKTRLVLEVYSSWVFFFTAFIHMIHNYTMVYQIVYGILSILATSLLIFNKKLLFSCSKKNDTGFKETEVTRLFKYSAIEISESFLVNYELCIDKIAPLLPSIVLILWQILDLALIFNLHKAYYL